MSGNGVQRFTLDYDKNPDREPCRCDMVEDYYNGYYVTYDSYMLLLREYADY